jgi:hypothetical protein
MNSFSMTYIFLVDYLMMLFNIETAEHQMNWEGFGRKSQTNQGITCHLPRGTEDNWHDMLFIKLLLILTHTYMAVHSVNNTEI